MGEENIIIAARFRGPPESGNGGYVAGCLANRFGGAVEVTLRRPTPLDRPLSLGGDGTSLHLSDGDELIAEARSAPLDLAVPTPPPPAAIAAAEEDADFGAGDYGTCFACGRHRHPPDGLCIRPRWISHDPPVVAALWTPHPALADTHGRVPPEMIWAALDCPGGLAVLGHEAAVALTGRIHAEVAPDLRPGETYRVIGWSVGAEGRKRYAGTALVDAGGYVRGRALATWILLAPR